jgi:hypothetical protein
MRRERWPLQTRGAGLGDGCGRQTEIESQSMLISTQLISDLPRGRMAWPEKAATGLG